MSSRDSFDRFQPRERGMFGENDNPNKKAIAVSLDIHTPFAKWAWLPRSLIEYEVTGKDTVRVTLPERTAKEKGLI